MTTTLYRFFDIDHRLLYVGITADLGKRFQAHASGKPWWSDVTHVRTTHYETRHEASIAEQQAIRDENPLYNLARTQKSGPTPTADRRDDLGPTCSGCGYRPGGWRSDHGRTRASS